jgi:hypothetical protein
MPPASTCWSPSRPDTPSLSKNTVMNAGAFAARLGLRGAPPEAEWIALERDLMLAETTGVRLLADCISTARSLAAVERAREAGVKVSCSVAAYSLFFNELDVGDYLTYCKVQPPFRIESDRMALIDGLETRRNRYCRLSPRSATDRKQAPADRGCFLRRRWPRNAAAPPCSASLSAKTSRCWLR